METLTDTLYSRAIRIDGHYYEIQPGDQVDNSLEMELDWCTVERIGTHADDRENEYAPDDRYCEGDCYAVIFFEADDCTYPFHLSPSSEIYARFPVGEVTG